MDHIWAPWRMKYIQEHQGYEECVFCVAARAKDDGENLIFYRGTEVFIILNRFPYTSGHIMCVPFAHKNQLQDLTKAARSEMMDLTSRAVEVLQAVYEPDGFNVGMNQGAMAGAGVAEHLHMHIVPRWGGDNNFMSTVGRTRVLPESLAETFKRVKAAWESFK